MKLNAEILIVIIVFHVTIDIREITFYLISNTFPEQNETCVQLYIVQ